MSSQASPPPSTTASPPLPRPPAPSSNPLSHIEQTILENLAPHIPPTASNPLISSALTSIRSLAEDRLAALHTYNVSVDGSLHNAPSISPSIDVADSPDFVGLVTRVLNLINTCISVIVFSIQFTIATTVIFLLAAVSYQTLYYLLIPTHIYTTTVPIIYSSTSAIGVRDFTTLLSWKVPEYFNEEYYCDTAVPADSTLALNVLDLDQLLPDPHRFQGPSSKTCMNKEGKMEEKNKPPVVIDSPFRPGKSYYVDVSLTLPRSPLNTNYGMFVASLTLHSPSQPLASERRSLRIPHDSPAVNLIRTIAFSWLYIFDILRDDATLSTTFYNHFKETSDRTTKLQLSIDPVYSDIGRNPEIIEAQIVVGRELKDWQRLMKDKYWVCFTIGVTYLMIVYGIVGGVVYKMVDNYLEKTRKEEEEAREELRRQREEELQAEAEMMAREREGERGGEEEGGREDSMEDKEVKEEAPPVFGADDDFVPLDGEGEHRTVGAQKAENKAVDRVMSGWVERDQIMTDIECEDDPDN